MKITKEEIRKMADTFKDLEDKYDNSQDADEQKTFESAIIKLTEELFQYENALEAMLEIDEIILNS